MVVRKATSGDILQLSGLFDAYRQFYRKRSNVQGAERFLSERLKHQDSEIFVVETETQQLIGFVQLYPLFSSTKMKRLWLLNDLFVTPNYRGQKVSVLLINRAKELVKETNACGMYLETETSNDIGNQLYPRTGFKRMEDSHFYEWLVD